MSVKALDVTLPYIPIIVGVSFGGEVTSSGV